MTRLQSFLHKIVLALVLSTGSLVAHAGDKGYFGFAISIETEGFSFNPTLKSITVDKIIPGSPAESAGLAKGDQFLEVEGHIVAGAKADDLKPYLSRNAGETIGLKVKKVSGQIVSTTLTAAKKP